MGGQVTDTFTDSQGHTIHGDVAIDLGGLTATATEHAAYTALTRATGDIDLLMGAQIPTSARIETAWSKSQILTAILTVASVHNTPIITPAVDVDGLISSAVLSHISRCLSPRARARLGLPGPNPIVGVQGVSATDRADWLNTPTPAGDVYTARTHRAVRRDAPDRGTKAFSRHTESVTHSSVSPVAHLVRHFTAVAEDAILSTTPSNYKLPPMPVFSGPHDTALDINEPTDDATREIEANSDRDHWISTKQHVPDGAPDTLHHTRADKLTDELGKQKRIHLGEHDGRLSRSDLGRLASLKRGFKKFFDIGSWNDFPFSPGLMDMSNRTALASWASKRTKAQLVRSVEKQSLDTNHNFVRLFPKGQFIKKKPKWRSNAFPSQTVSDFHLGRIFRDAPYATYMETLALRFARKTTYLHCRASPADLSKWYKAHWPRAPMTGNDYTAWDSGVDHVFLEFDLWLMNLCHFPSEFIEQHRELRLTTRSHLGNHLPRQESGDRWTWLLNTLRNAALTGASLACPDGTPIAVSGDDSVTSGVWPTPSNFHANQWSMKPKRETADKMEFCGLMFGGPDITFDPVVIMWRSRFGHQQGRRDPDYWRSIRDAIAEASDKIGTDSKYLRAAVENVNRAVLWYNLSSELIVPVEPDAPAPPRPPNLFLRILYYFLFL